jgi:hypothetical protein
MFKFIQNRLKNLPSLAEAAVSYAETTFAGPCRGQEKKQAAVDFVMRHLTLPSGIRFLEPVLRSILRQVIDVAIECSVAKLKNSIK